MADAVLERFHRALIEEIQTQRPEYLTQPFTVAEIYQNLVPYGSHRDRIGVEMNGDYEDALVRLLAGEGGYLILDSEPALENLRAELETPNPNTGVYREFAAVDVRLNQAYLDLSAEAMDQLPDLYEELEAEDPVAMTDLAPAEGTASMEELGVVPPGVDIFAESNGPQVDTGHRGGEAASDEEAQARPAPALEEAQARPAPAPDVVTEAGGGETVSGEDHVEETSADAPRRRPPLEPEFVDEGEPMDGSEGTGGASERVGRVGSVPGGSCLWCQADLPDRDTLNFCPFCGTDVNVVPCPSCGDEVQPAWRFCASCGTEVDS